MSDDKIVKLVPTSVGEDYPIEVSNVLQSAIDEGLKHVVVVGLDTEGSLYLAADVGLFETYFMLGEAMAKITANEFTQSP